MVGENFSRWDVGILGRMRSAVAEKLREEQQREMLSLSVEERVELARKLGEEGIALLMATQHIDRDEAIRRIARGHKAGRQRSVLNDE
jgi:isopropylmalate/homocitrate/citramalate synthase